jgi:hypothetical protein
VRARYVIKGELDFRSKLEEPFEQTQCKDWTYCFSETLMLIMITDSDIARNFLRGVPAGKENP